MWITFRVATVQSLTCRLKYTERNAIQGCIRNSVETASNSQSRFGEKNYDFDCLWMFFFRNESKKEGQYLTACSNEKNVSIWVNYRYMYMYCSYNCNPPKRKLLLKRLRLIIRFIVTHASKTTETRLLRGSFPLSYIIFHYLVYLFFCCFVF